MTKRLSLYFVTDFAYCSLLGSSSQDRDIINHVVIPDGSHQADKAPRAIALRKDPVLLLKCQTSPGAGKRVNLPGRFQHLQGFCEQYSKGLGLSHLYPAGFDCSFSLSCLKMRPFNFPPFFFFLVQEKGSVSKSSC